MREDPRSAEVIKPYLRGQDIKRWSPEWKGLWTLVLKSSGDHVWPWSNADDPEEVFRRTYPSLHAHMKLLDEKLRKRRDKGRHWWELRTCAYYGAFEKPKILYPNITWRSSFSLDTGKRIFNNTVYFLSADSAWLIAVLNSPLMWSYCWRNAAHGKDEALRFFSDFVQHIPIAQPTDETRSVAEGAALRLISLLTQADQEARCDTLDWLRMEFGVEKSGQKLEDFASLGPDAFVEEVRKRRPKGEGRLTPGSLRDLRSGYPEMAEPVKQARTEAASLERKLSDLVNRAHGLTEDEVDLLWKTAPPRMPRCA